MSSFISQNEVNMAKKPLKVEQPLQEGSSEIHKLVYDLYQIFPRHQNYRDGDPKLQKSQLLQNSYKNSCKIL